jgi:hypothetical protein
MRSKAILYVRNQRRNFVELEPDSQNFDQNQWIQKIDDFLIGSLKVFEVFSSDDVLNEVFQLWVEVENR